MILGVIGGIAVWAVIGGLAFHSAPLVFVGGVAALASVGLILVAHIGAE